VDDESSVSNWNSWTVCLTCRSMKRGALFGAFFFLVSLRRMTWFTSHRNGHRTKAGPAPDNRKCRIASSRKGAPPGDLAAVSPGAAWNTTMEPVAVSRRVEQPAHDLSGFRILAADLACELRALLFGHAVQVSTVHPLTTACTLAQRSAKSSLKV
jgi:hypothetical protein